MVGGYVLIAVPDLEKIFNVFLNADVNMRWELIKILYGGQIDQYDYHHTGFSEDVLTEILLNHGFCSIKRVVKFGITENDLSNARLRYVDKFEGIWKDVSVSLNIIARKCPEGYEVLKREDRKVHEFLDGDGGGGTEITFDGLVYSSSYNS
jgi:hypothetical protein